MQFQQPAKHRTPPSNFFVFSIGIQYSSHGAQHGSCVWTGAVFGCVWIGTASADKWEIFFQEIQVRRVLNIFFDQCLSAVTDEASSRGVRTAVVVL